MHKSIPDLPEAEAGYDPALDRWHLRLGGQTFMLRDWNWGERKRLLRAACSTGQADGGALAEGFCALLFDPIPPPELARLFAYAGLQLLGADRSPRQISLAEAEAALAMKFGLMPSAIEAERIADIDALVSATGPQRMPESGWSCIEIGDTGSEQAG
jgi:hypothetical protein